MNGFGLCAFWLGSSVGSYVTSFENSVADFCGVDYGIAVVNGTAGLELALKACELQPNDEVLLPSLTFVATANAVNNVVQYLIF